jgi:hypothetical protein
MHLEMGDGAEEFEVASKAQPQETKRPPSPTFPPSPISRAHNTMNEEKPTISKQSYCKQNKLTTMFVTQASWRSYEQEQVQGGWYIKG